MSSNAAQSDDEIRTRFKPFTRQSLADIEARIAEQAARKVEWDRLKVEVAIRPDGMEGHQTIPPHEDGLKPDLTLRVGMPLPHRIATLFPEDLIATPIEDLDKYYENKRTFMIISRGKYVFRFSAAKSLFILTPFNPLRRAVIHILVHPVFSFLIIFTILVNSVLLAIPNNEATEKTDIIFLSIFTVESCIKVAARGFILEKFTYLRDPWNWLDLTVIALAFTTFGIDLGHLNVLNAFRLLKALQIVAILPGLKIIVEAITESIKNLKDVMILTAFSLSVFALLGLEIYMGVLTQKCVFNPDSELNLTWSEYAFNYSRTVENWLIEDGEFILCGNSTGARQCPEGSTCVQGIGPNPDYGYTAFDNFPLALLSSFRLIMRDFWENVYRMVIVTAGPWHMCFFVVIIFLGSYYLVNVILAIVLYDDFQKKAKYDEAIAAEEATLAAPDKDIEDYPESNNLVSKKPSDSTYPDLNVQTVTNIKGKKEAETSDFKKCCWENCLKCINIFSDWNCCPYWIKFQSILELIFFDPFMELFFVICIVLNTLFMAMDHHDMDPDFSEFLQQGFYLFTVTFAIEAGFKVIALSPKKYFSEVWNIVDFIVTVGALIELGLEVVSGFSVYRYIRLLKVFTLAKSWHTLDRLISVTWKTMGALGNLTFVLGILTFTFAVMGMQLFGRNYEENKHLFIGGKVPYWNFTDFIHSFMIVFRVLCGEWIESMFDCMLVSGWPCLPFFLSTIVIGNLVMLNLFLSLLLTSFGASNVSQIHPDKSETRKLQEAVKRFSKACNWIKNYALQILKFLQIKNPNQLSDQKSETVLEKLPEDLPAGESAAGQVSSMDKFSKQGTNVSIAEDMDNASNQETLKRGSEISWGEPDSDKYAENCEEIIDEGPADCFSDCCYVRFPVCKGNKSYFWSKWDNARKKTFIVVEHKYFKTIFIIISLISSFALAAEDIYLQYRPFLTDVLRTADTVFTVIFLLEMLLKWLAYGFKKYFSDSWRWLDFAILLVSMFNLVLGLIGYANIPVFKVFRAFRAISQLEGIRVVLNTLVQAIPDIFNVFLVCLLFWFVFAILGVHLMSGKFFSCEDDYMILLNSTFVPDRETCLENNLTWKNSQINFDNVLNAYQALFQVATFKDWVVIMRDAVDSTGVDLQPQSEASIYMYFYFIIFIIFGSFVTLNLFIGVIIENFNKQKEKAGGALEMFMTEEQKNPSDAKKEMEKPVKAITGSQLKLRTVVLNVTTNERFDMAIMILIVLNMAVLAMDHYNPTDLFETIMELLNIFFNAIFTVECLLKIFALRTDYLKDAWNVFDFVVITLSILGIVLKDLIENYFVSPAFLPVVRVMKVGRVLRLVKGARGIRTLLLTLFQSLPALFNIFLLLFLVMFIYAIFGMHFFSYLRHRGGVDQNFNFETFGQSMILLFQLSTSAGFDSVFVAITNEEDCYKGEYTDCGSRNIAVVYLLSYTMITSLIIINMYIMVVQKTNILKRVNI